MLKTLRKIPVPAIIAVVVAIGIAAILATFWFDPQRGQWGYSYYKDTADINSNDASSAIIGYYTRALFVVTAVLSVVAVIQINFLIRADRNAREAVVADQRAFVFASNIQGAWRKVGTGTYTWVLRPMWRNSGKTPTRRLRIMTSGEIRAQLVSNDIDPTRDDGTIGAGFIGPGVESFGGSWPFQNQLTQQDVADLISGRRVCYLWGYAKYFDAFSWDVEHTTRFCWLITVSGDPMTVPRGAAAPAIQWGFVQHMKGNHADEQ